MLDLSKLCVLTTEGGVPAQAGWNAPEASFFAAETCARHIYIYPAEAASLVPESVLANRKTRVYQGAEAYAFLLKFLCGFESKKSSDQHVTHQMVEDWRKYAKKSPDESKVMQPYMDALFHDGAKIRATMLDKYLRHSSVTRAAVRLAAPKPGEDVLLIAGNTDLTIEAVKAMVGNKRRCPDTIYITEQSDAERRVLVDAFRSALNYREIMKHVKFISLKSALTTEIFKANAVLVCQPMAAPGDITSPLAHLNEQIADAWMQRCTGGFEAGKILHLRGYPEGRGETAGPWLAFDGEKDGFYSYARIREEHSRTLDFAKRLTAKALAVIAQMTKFRIQGDRIKELNFDPETMDVQYRMAKRQLGYAPAATA